MTSRHWSVLLALSSVAFVVASTVQRGSLDTVWGDESTYLAMAESLARDGDLLFTAADAERLAAEAPSRRSTVILQRNDAGVGYSKPILYPLLAAPFTAVAGPAGPLLLNALCLALAGWLAWLFLRRLGEPGRAALTAVTFVGASVLLANVGWRMSDLLQATLALAGLVLAIAPLRARGEGRAGAWLDGRAAAWTGGALLGLMVTARLPNLLVAGAAVAALAVCGRPRRALRVALAAALALLAVAVLSQAMIGTASPYRAVRSSFDGADGYPLGPQSATWERFDSHRTTQRMTWAPDLRPRVTAYSTLYFWVGRHTGLLWYFPAVAALLLAALAGADRATAVLLAGAAAMACFYLVWWPENYFGGAAFLGNRYFLVAYPLLLVALPRLPGPRGLSISWLLAASMAVSALVAQADARPATVNSQVHTRAGVPRRLPYESTARAIDGRRDRYWARDLLRFLDPVPAVGADSFTLRPGAPPAELMLVTARPDGSVLLRYRTRGHGLALLVRERDGEQRYPLEGGAQVRHGTLVVPLAAGWRHHPFWWNPQVVYSARVVELEIDGGDAGDAPVSLWYGGDRGLLERSFEAQGPSPGLPERAAAGSTSELPVRVRNTSPVPWLRGGAYPVRLSYRLLELEEGRVVEGPRVELPGDVASGDAVDLVLPIAWPDEPGRYRVDVDLVIEDYAWFAERRGRPLARGEVTVE